MSDEGRRKPPPRFPRPGDPELVRVTEDEAPATQREVILPPPRAPREPFRVVKGRVETIPELGDRIATLGARLDDAIADVRAVSTTQAAILGVQRNMALQVDGLGSAMNQRADILHQEMALIRHTQDELLKIVQGDHAPRIGKVEASLGQKAAKGGGMVALVLVALPMLADALPRYAHIFDAVLGVLR